MLCIHIMSLKERFVFIMMFIIIQLSVCQNVGKIHCVGKGIHRVGP